MARAAAVLFVALFTLTSAQAGTLFAVLDSNGNIIHTAEVDADKAAVPKDGSCVGCVVIVPDDAKLLAFRASQTKPPTTISADAFRLRFTDAQQAAAWAAAAKDVTGAIGAGLTNGLTAGAIDLNDKRVKDWIGRLVAAGALTQAQGDNILSPNFSAPQ